MQTSDVFPRKTGECPQNSDPLVQGQKSVMLMLLKPIARNTSNETALKVSDFSGAY